MAEQAFHLWEYSALANTEACFRFFLNRMIFHPIIKHLFQQKQNYVNHSVLPDLNDKDIQMRNETISIIPEMNKLTSE